MEPEKMTTTVEQLYRKPAAKAAGGYVSDSEFYEAIKRGEFPRPDGYLGPRSPFWTGDALRAHQRRLLAQPKRTLKPVAQPSAA